MYTAIKAVYNRSCKRYTVTVFRNADLILCHHGYFVFDNATQALEGVRSGRYLQHWNKEAIIDWLESESRIQNS